MTPVPLVLWLLVATGAWATSPSPAPSASPAPAPPAVLILAALDGDATRMTLLVAFTGRPELAAARTSSRLVSVTFRNAQFPDGVRSFEPPSGLVEAASLAQTSPDLVTLTMVVREGAAVHFYENGPKAELGTTCALIVHEESGELGRSGVALTWPVKGRVSSRYGWRMHPILHEARMHHGIDIAVPEGSPIRSMAEGKVTWADWKGGSGLCVTVRHEGGLESTYKHCSRLKVKLGERVARHQIIAEAGQTGLATGSHLHFTVTEHGQSVNPLRYLEK